jgi:glycogen debranching enzyme
LDQAEITIPQQYYIAPRESTQDGHSRVLKYGKVFAVFDRYGNIRTSGSGEQGLFYRGTRHLSEFVLEIWNSSPLLLSSTIKADNCFFNADLTNVDVWSKGNIMVARGILHILRSRFLWNHSCYEQLKLKNFGNHAIHIPLVLTFAADFADIFEVRGMHRERRGRLCDPKIREGEIVLSYQGLDRVLRETAIQFQGAPAQISGSELRCSIALAPREETTIEITVKCMRGTEDGRQISYSDGLRTVSHELDEALESFPQIFSTNSRFTDWMKRSTADVVMMTIGNPEANYPYAGVPWFSTVFGRDGIITALETLWLCPSIAKGVLEFLAATQATEVNLESEAAPGKILHEMRGGEMASLGEVPFGRYYGSVDATPLFLVLAGSYYERTGDRDFIEKLFPHCERALNWMNDYGDLDGDGFVEYASHSERGLVQQGWKDSNDSVFHADGSLAEAPIALCEVQGYVYAAKLAMAKITSMLGDEERSQAIRVEADVLRRNFEEAFWCPELCTYALALDGRKKACRVRSSNPGHCLFSGIASQERAALVTKTLLERSQFTGWGVRTVAMDAARYNPMSYHNGSVWPHDNAILAAGMARYGFHESAGQILLAMLDTSSLVDLYRLPELFCGLERRQGEGPTLYPVACSPQAWSAAAGFLILQACLRIEIDDARRRIVFNRPLLPAGIPQLFLNGLRCGQSSVDLSLSRDSNSVAIQVLSKRGDIDIVIR